MKLRRSLFLFVLSGATILTSCTPTENPDIVDPTPEPKPEPEVPSTMIAILI